MQQPTVLVVDDEPQTVRLLSVNLKASGYRVLAAYDGLEALKAMEDHPVDLVLLDIALPGPDGFEVCRRIQDTYGTPVIMVSARGQERDKVKALDIGAQDYLTKPFSMAELLARVRVVLRRSKEAAPSQQATIAWDEFVLDFRNHTLTRAGQPVPLSPTEFRLLAYLAKNAGRTLTHRALLQEAWGAEYAADTTSLWSYIWRLRRKIEADPQHPKHLIAKYGAGYQFNP
ncbi:MAG: response regulator transcription factor [Chloroflexi bacterium]|nr:response regulator transcription factor [Chloroflexota bacterium]